MQEPAEPDEVGSTADSAEPKTRPATGFPRTSGAKRRMVLGSEGGLAGECRSRPSPTKWARPQLRQNPRPDRQPDFRGPAERSDGWSSGVREGSPGNAGAGRARRSGLDRRFGRTQDPTGNRISADQRSEATDGPRE